MQESQHILFSIAQQPPHTAGLDQHALDRNWSPAPAGWIILSKILKPRVLTSSLRKCCSFLFKQVLVSYCFSTRENARTATLRSYPGRHNTTVAAQVVLQLRPSRSSSCCSSENTSFGEPLPLISEPIVWLREGQELEKASRCIEKLVLLAFWSETVEGSLEASKLRWGKASKANKNNNKSSTHFEWRKILAAGGESGLGGLCLACTWSSGVVNPSHPPATKLM